MLSVDTLPVKVILVAALSALACLSEVCDAHPCDGVKVNTRVCDPSRGGRYFYWCMANGIRFQYKCPHGLVFNNAAQICDWPYNTECVATTTDSPVTTTPSTSTPASSGSTTPSTPVVTVSTTTSPVPTGPCSPATCRLPTCRCLGTDIPGNLDPAVVPQMVLLTFDDAVNAGNFHYYEGLFPANRDKAIKNPNGCPTAATFFVSKSYTDMNMVKTLADRGSEVASHSLDHSWPTTWSRADWYRQMQGMRKDLARATGLPLAKIGGMRAPYLVLGGDDQFSMLQNQTFLYDSTMFGGDLQEYPTTTPVWPFTLKYPVQSSTQMCDQGNCPTGTYPTVWEVPLVRQYNVQGQACSMTDSCSLPGGSAATKDDVKRFLLHNFDRHYAKNRAPFMISLHATWFRNIPQSYQGLFEFLTEISTMKDVWQVTASQMLDWVRQPLPLEHLNQIPSWRCA